MASSIPQLTSDLPLRIGKGVRFIVETDDLSAGQDERKMTVFVPSMPGLPQGAVATLTGDHVPGLRAILRRC